MSIEYLKYFVKKIHSNCPAAGTNVFVYMITGLVGFNFLFELGLNIILSPTIVKLTKLGRKEK